MKEPIFKPKDICISFAGEHPSSVWIYYVLSCEENYYNTIHNKLPSVGPQISYTSQVEKHSKLIKENATEEEFKNILKHYKENSIFF